MAQRTASLDLFVVLSPFREVVPELQILLRPLALLEGRMLGVEGYAAATADAALINLRLDRKAVARVGVGRLVSVIGGLGLTAFAPEALPVGEQQDFYLHHLAAYDTYVQLYADAGESRLIERLVAALAEHVAVKATRRPSTYGEALDGDPTFIRPLARRAAAPRRAGRAPSFA